MAAGHDVATFDFPQYDQPSSYFVTRYLNGDYGQADEVGPYTSSLFYALDRFEASNKIQAALEAGQVVLSNRVVPYQSYLLHHGAIHETMFAPANDLNFYDTNHYEVELLLDALHTKIDLTGATIFANVMHCPTCARMLSRTGIAEFVYAQDHSDGYAVRLLEAAGKKVRRIVP